MDDERLTAFRRYADGEAAIAEEFLDRRLGPWQSFALLSEPLLKPRPLGWVVCPSLGPEHGNLRRLEALVAGSLARAGFPVLRIRPDLDPAGGAFAEIDVAARSAEVEEGAALLRDRGSLDAVALFGALFGGTTAALAAQRVDAAALVLVEPALRGTRYLRETVRRQAIAELVAAGDDDPLRRSPASTQPKSSGTLDELATAGEAWIRGMRLTRAEYERIAQIDLLEQPLGFEGHSLVVGISPSGAPSAGLQRLRDRLVDAGGEARLSVLDDPLPAPFGEYYYRNAGGVRIDTRLELDQRIASTTTAWAAGALDELARRAAA